LNVVEIFSVIEQKWAELKMTSCHGDGRS